MSRRTRIWMVVAVIFTLVNLGGAVAAAFAGEVMHAATHAGLIVATAVVVWRLVPRRAVNH